MRSIDVTARRLGLSGKLRGGLMAALLDWRHPSLTLMLLISGFRDYFKKVQLVLQTGGTNAGFLPSFSLSNIGIEGSTGPLFAVVAYAAMTLLSSLTAKLLSFYEYLDPLNSLMKHAYIDTHHTYQVESHKWLACLLEGSREYKRSRD